MNPPSLFLFFLMAMALVARADSGPLVRIGESWSYFKTARGGPVPSARWQEGNFSPAGWRTAPSGFVVPEEEPGQASLLQPQPFHAYARKTFTVVDPKSVHALQLAVEHEEGFTAYLNGVEIDWKDEMMAKGFVFKNPNATHTCGCGSSFQA